MSRSRSGRRRRPRSRARKKRARSSAFDTSPPAAHCNEGLPTVTSWRGRRKYPCACRPAIRIELSEAVVAARLVDADLRRFENSSAVPPDRHSLEFHPETWANNRRRLHGSWAAVSGTWLPRRATAPLRLRRINRYAQSSTRRATPSTPGIREATSCDSASATCLERAAKTLPVRATTRSSPRVTREGGFGQGT
jgi:hypothetical protein